MKHGQPSFSFVYAGAYQLKIYCQGYWSVTQCLPHDIIILLGHFVVSGHCVVLQYFINHCDNLLSGWKSFVDLYHWIKC